MTYNVFSGTLNPTQSISHLEFSSMLLPAPSSYHKIEEVTEQKLWLWVYLILTNLPTVNTIPLTQPSDIHVFMTISSLQWHHRRCHVCVSLTSLLPLTPLTIAS